MADRTDKAQSRAHASERTPSPDSATKKTVTKKTGTKKTGTKKTGTKKTGTEKAGATKRSNPPTKPSEASSSAARQPATTGSAAKKSAPKKSAAKKSAAKKSENGVRPITTTGSTRADSSKTGGEHTANPRSKASVVMNDTSEPTTPPDKSATESTGQVAHSSATEHVTASTAAASTKVADQSNSTTTPTVAASTDTQSSPPAIPPSREVVEVTVTSRTLWRIVTVVALAAAAFWALSATRQLVEILVVSLFFALALLPAVNHLHNTRQWRRGAAVGVIYLGGLVFIAFLIAVLIPSISRFATQLGDHGDEWLSKGNEWASKNLGINLNESTQTKDATAQASDSLENWGANAFGTALNVAQSGIGLVFNLATIAMFTFYFTADFGRLRHWVLSLTKPEHQARLGWTIDEAIRQTGGYFYSRMILMAICGTGFFITLVVVGVPVPLAVGLGMFGGFVSEFIPAIGTYIGAAIPVLVALATAGVVAALVVIGFALVYQQIENYWLSPRLSAKTMSLNGAVAFAAALAGGSLLGPIGAFMALPVAAVITSFVNNYGHTYDVIDSSVYADDPVAPPKVSPPPQSAGAAPDAVS